MYRGATPLYSLGGALLPFEHTGYKDEILASKPPLGSDSAPMNSPVYDVKGPDAVKFLNLIAVNDFTNLNDSGIRHAVICNEKGQILTDGVVIKIAEDTYRTYWLNPPIDYLVKTSGMDVEGEDITGREYFIQIAGEKSLEILEEACQCDLHDIEFATHHDKNRRKGYAGNPDWYDRKSGL